MGSSRKFYDLTARERLEVLEAAGEISVDDAAELRRVNEAGVLPVDVAAHLIENQVSQYALPFSVIRGLVVNGKSYTVPMVVEEASVVAAASHGAHMAARCGSINAQSEPHRVIGEIVFEASNVSVEKAQSILVSRGTQIQDIARTALPSMHARGGGLESIEVDSVGSFTRFILTVNPCDAMGANAVNTIAEALKNELSQWLGASALVAILTNSGQASVTTAEVELSPESVAMRGSDPEQLIQRIARLSDLAAVDPQRAVTHNKGIMNGISAAVVASGNDWRAVESSAHAYAAKNGTYKPLSTWQVNEKGNLCGRIEIPLQVGIVGGAASSLPVAKIARRVCGCTTVDEFKNVLAALGLVQNLSALRALAGPGIQAGHMNLQMNALAIAAGARGEEINKVVEQLRALPSHKRTSATAEYLVKALRA
ncbi:hydroxymethylglutaryl-CoA reductase, degradative [Alloscardovia omnicolens]|uniref:hydroxymethylglutaryl-CoA reductase, degradative n=1 Tax=Alloscardovia omnicolens TaxID=419015 RepID=UPI00254C8910|nr:hydroxymethylglutaryl-CoA reductase, degradative [Alloscardovia omnicolens]MDK6251694.1 hydroxymethylglutaryl-CoA reductase, degradative [Alloscardovia omnicolens]